MRVLPTIDGYTIDYRLQEFRRAVIGEELVFISFDTAQGRRLLQKVWQDARLVVAHEGDDLTAWVCVCGNTPHEEGFFACNWAGEEVMPIAFIWTPPLCWCNRCGRIIDADSRAVVSLAV
jgi:hypothetical protein